MICLRDIATKGPGTVLSSESIVMHDCLGAMRGNTLRVRCRDKKKDIGMFLARASRAPQRPCDDSLYYLKQVVLPWTYFHAGAACDGDSYGRLSAEEGPETMEPTESGGRACPPMCPSLGWHLTLEMSLIVAIPLTVRYAY